MPRITPTNISQMKAAMPLLGAALAIVSLYFVGQKIYHNFNELVGGSLMTTQVLIIIGVLSVIFALFSNALGLAWRFLLLAEGGSITNKLALSVFGKSQIAKYLPGNVFHMLGRQVLAAQHGYGHRMLLKTTLWEIFLHAFAAGIFGSMLLVYAFPSGLSRFYAILMTIILMVALPAVSRVIERQRVCAFCAYLVFHMMGALLFAFLVSYFSGYTLHLGEFAIVTGAYAIAWLAGFVVPGAPGGLGVREFVLYLLISPWVEDKALLNAIIVSRVVTTLGDVGFFLIGYMLDVNKFKGSSASYSH